jgi:carotenoid 9,10(9',10')-cleavage dioxygenase 1
MNKMDLHSMDLSLLKRYGKFRIISSTNIFSTYKRRQKRVKMMAENEDHSNFFRIQSREDKCLFDENFRSRSWVENAPKDGSLYFPVEDYGEHGAAFLSGNFLPIRKECTSFLSADWKPKTDEKSLRIIGAVPEDFPAGQFAYVGPNPKFEVQNYKVWGKGPDQTDFNVSNGWHHWFEGDGMIYALDFKTDSKLCYRNRFIRTKSWKDESELGGRLFRPLMNAEGSTFLLNAIANLISGGAFLKDSGNTALVHFAGRTLALQDTMPPWELHPERLTTLGACNFDNQLPPYIPFTAHPKVAPLTGDLVFFGFNPVYPPHCSIGSLDQNGNIKDLTPLWSFPFAGCVFMHDFCVTEKYTILFEGSLDIKPIRQFFGRHPLQYNNDKSARFGVFSRDADVPIARWFECSCAQMVYHFINSWEEINSIGQEEIVIIGIREDGFFHNALKARDTRDWITRTLEENLALPRVHEWRINLDDGSVKERYLHEDIVEIPRINDEFTGLRNRYAYAGRIKTETLKKDAQLKFDAVIKFDFETGKKKIFEHGPGRYGMETQFVSRLNTTKKSEDDGWLLLYVHDENITESSQPHSECIILNAQDISSGPVARIILPDRIPYGAHAMWRPDLLSSEKRQTEINELISFVDVKPKKFTFLASQVDDLLGTLSCGILRFASSLFVNGWRPWLRKKDSNLNQYSFVGTGGYELDEVCSLGSMRTAQALKEARRGAQESPHLILYDLETDGECRRVREALCMLDLAFECRPCPYGAYRHRTLAAKLQNVSLGEEILPFLHDSRSKVSVMGAEDVLDYLYDIYLDGSAPSPLVVNKGTVEIAIKSRKKELSSISHSKMPYRYPIKPIELWAYEASPFCSLVREKFCEMEVPYILRPCSRGSPRRNELLRKTKTFQVPFIEDTNTGMNLFESAEIVKYLNKTYSYN